MPRECTLDYFRDFLIDYKFGFEFISKNASGLYDVHHMGLETVSAKIEYPHKTSTIGLEQTSKQASRHGLEHGEATGQARVGQQ